MDASRLHSPAGSIAALALAFAASGCFPGAKHEVTPQRPVIRAFTATPGSILPGGTAQLSWLVIDATSLSIDPGVGTVTGTTVAVTPAVTTTYTLTATSAAGSSTASATVIVVVAPAGLAYSTNPATYTVGTSITANTPSSTGGAITSYGVSPALPAGLSLSTTTGILTGTPTAATALAVYTVTGTNASGSTTVALTVTVTTSSTAPAGLTYSTNPATYTVGTSIAANTPSSTGGTITSYAVSPALPAGLSLNATTGIVTGTPTAATALAAYTVTGTNASGSTTVALTVTVAPSSGPPAGLTYSTNPATYRSGETIAPNNPSSTGGAIATYGVSPNLPAGLSLSPTTGVITGIPAAATPLAVYTVTGLNLSGGTSAALTLTVSSSSGAPAGLAYSTNPAIYRVGESIVDNYPRSTGGTITSYGVSPALPAGLSLDTTYGVITGIPTAATPLAVYTITGQNGSGSTTAALTLTVTASSGAPAGLTYLDNPVSYTAGTLIVPNSPASTGGTITSYAVSPALPVGLSLNPTTGVITGTPTAATALANYAVTGSNAAGSTSVNLGLAVTGAPVITVQPVSQSVVPPATATFTVTATGAGALFFQWSRNGTDIPGANAASYTIPASTGAVTGSLFRVLVIDEFGGSVTSAPATLTTQGFSSTGAMSVAREFHTATLLANGKVLVTGGNSGAATLRSAEIYDPATGTFSATGSMFTERQGHAATLLLDGRVLVSGGFSGAGYLASAEIFDPAGGPGGIGAFTRTAGDLPQARMNFSSTLLPNGKVLVSGGFLQTGGGAIVDVYLSTAALFTPGTDSFAATVPLSTKRAGPVAVLLDGGKVLVAGGRGDAGVVATADVYDPAAVTFTPTSGAMGSPRESFTVTALGLTGIPPAAVGPVLVAGGFDGAGDIATADLYYPNTTTFPSTGSMGAARAFQSASLLSNGKVVVAGGASGLSILGTAELFDPAAAGGAGAFAAAPGQDLITPRYSQTATVLQNGQVLLVGGRGITGVLSSAEIWTTVP